ncbi:MAG TPA: double-cubane-cluster-containing anaerobic reductase [Anaerohalosphaeraceae bacterium]|jgi:benzoyl-CoA reductase/2-hydroxyglutaryl-CoA dehydratase subunit BcrC/BadD/HgdB|nr:double-cubane-cluster-containing anaerobic reductase [Anaerohalosphaeraceae bacterium]HRT50638.1 double-cubane-cluster-containing anaerobic reductase [Anaerohalosphaeraceae bacterium]HRT86537.1 double-cubane-cluster-containing anaerobic reductase [Anaerohalosphaeraceae bacterium]
MSECCQDKGSPGTDEPLSWFANMIGNCYEYATKAKGKGRGVVGIMCEFTPRELIMAAGAVPVCLCGGSQQMIGPAEQHLPANLCPLIKSTYGYHVQKANPFLGMADLVVAETTCDGKKKMYELLGESKPMHVLELTQKCDDGDALRHWRSELDKLKGVLEETFGTTITDEKIRQAIGTMNRERRLRRGLARLMAADVPPITGRQLLDLKSIISGIEADLEQYERAIKFYGSRPCSAGGKRAARVLLTGVPVVHGAERVVDLIEECGGLVVCMENCTGLKPILEDVDETADDPMQAIAEKYFHLPCSVMTRNRRRLEVLRELVGEYRADCIIDLVWQACLTYDVESHFVKRLAAELGLGYLKIETDYSPSDSARIKVRVEALFETVRKD